MNPAHAAGVHRSRRTSVGFSSSSIWQLAEVHIALVSVTKIIAVSTTSCVASKRLHRTGVGAITSNQNCGPVSGLKAHAHGGDGGLPRLILRKCLPFTK
jgi:hypothetical protein